MLIDDGEKISDQPDSLLEIKPEFNDIISLREFTESQFKQRQYESRLRYQTKKLGRPLTPNEKRYLRQYGKMPKHSKN